MRIISPVDSLQEAALLLDAGADELYGGYVPESWNKYDLAASLNQRTFAAAQIATEEQFVGIVDEAHARFRKFSLTLNAPFYTDSQLPILTEYIDHMVEMGIDGLILADPGVMRLVRTRHPKLELHASTLAHLSNAGAVRLMAGQGVTRVVLPRHLSVADMAAIVRQVPEVSFDAFLLVGKCPNTEGLCTFHHASPEKVWPCEIPYEIEALQDGVSEDLRTAMQRQGSWSETNRRHGCGLCAIPHLIKNGIQGLKLVGRGAPAAQKARNIALVKEFICLAETCDDFTEYRRQAMAAHKERFGNACHQNVCYYPEFFYGGVE